MAMVDLRHVLAETPAILTNLRSLAQIISRLCYFSNWICLHPCICWQVHASRCSLTWCSRDCSICFHQSAFNILLLLYLPSRMCDICSMHALAWYAGLACCRCLARNRKRPAIHDLSVPFPVTKQVSINPVVVFRKN